MLEHKPITEGQKNWLNCHFPGGIFPEQLPKIKRWQANLLIRALKAIKSGKEPQRPHKCNFRPQSKKLENLEIFILHCRCGKVLQREIFSVQNVDGNEIKSTKTRRLKRLTMPPIVPGTVKKES